MSRIATPHAAFGPLTPESDASLARLAHPVAAPAALPELVFSVVPPDAESHESPDTASADAVAPLRPDLDVCHLSYADAACTERAQHAIELLQQFRETGHARTYLDAAAHLIGPTPLRPGAQEFANLFAALPGVARAVFEVSLSLDETPFPVISAVQGIGPDERVVPLTSDHARAVVAQFLDDLEREHGGAFYEALDALEVIHRDGLIGLYAVAAADAGLPTAAPSFAAAVRHRLLVQAATQRAAAPGSRLPFHVSPWVAMLHARTPVGDTAAFLSRPQQAGRVTRSLAHELVVTADGHPILTTAPCVCDTPAAAIYAESVRFAEDMLPDRASHRNWGSVIDVTITHACARCRCALPTQPGAAPHIRVP